MKRLVTITCLTLLVASAAVADPSPAIGIFFDTNAVSPIFTPENNTPFQAYVCAVHNEMMVCGGSFMLAMPADVTYLGESYPPGLPIGDAFTGVEIGLTTAIPNFGGTPAILCTLNLLAYQGIFANIDVLPHPGETSPIVADSAGVLYEVAGEPGYLTHGDPAEKLSWSEVKTLFR